MNKSFNPRWIVIAVAVIVWFILFPSDLDTLLLPVKQISQSLSLGAYILISTIVVCWTWNSHVPKSRNK